MTNESSVPFPTRHARGTWAGRMVRLGLALLSVFFVPIGCTEDDGGVSLTTPAPVAIAELDESGAPFVGDPYSATLRATGGTGSYSWALVSGALPSGLSLGTGGAISGTPTAEGTANFSVRATSGTQNATKSFSITVQQHKLTITTPSPLSAATRGQSYNAVLVATGGGVYAWTLSSGALPAGLILTSAGVISGSATNIEVATFGVQVTSGALSTTKEFTLAVDPPPLVFTGPSSLADAVHGSDYNSAFTATGGTGAYVFTMNAGTLPPGLALSSGGVLSGRPTAFGNWTFELKVVSGALSATRNFTLTVNTAPLSISTTSALPNGAQGQPYNTTIAATGGIGGYAWTIASGSLPSGLSISTSGVISGVPTSPGNASFVIRVTSGAESVTKSFTVSINAPLVITTTSPLSNATRGQAFTHAFAATGGTSGLVWTVISGAVPVGLALNNAGVLSGTPSVAGTTSFVVQVSSGATAASKNFELTVDQPPVTIMTASSLPSATEGQGYSVALSATGGSGSYVWTLANGTLPQGLVLSAPGVLSGIPTQDGTASFTIRVMSGAQSATKIFNLVVESPPLVITTVTPLASGTQGQAYTATLAATGGNGSYAWSLTSGSLPPGLSLSVAGAINGIPTSAMTSNFVVQVTSASLVASKSFSLTTNPPPVTISTASPLTNATQGQAYSVALTASGGTGFYSWTVASGTLPQGISLSAAGVLSGTPTVAGTATFGVRALSGAQTATKVFTLLVNTAAPIKLKWPVEGAYGVDWVINNYFDHDPTAGTRDYTGATGAAAKTYNDHYGIDIDIANFRAQDAGVRVLAVAAGVVESVHDNEPDRNITCVGNYNILSILHADGTRSQYVHLKQSSIRVAVGQTVAAGEAIAMVGSSGCSTAPHLHLWIIRGGQLIDPFELGLWENPPPYSPPLVLMDAGLRVGALTAQNYYAYVIDPTPNVTNVAVGANLGLGFVTAGGAIGDVVSAVVRRPNGTTYQILDYTLTSEVRHGFFFTNLAPLDAPGAWSVSISVNGQQRRQLQFTVN